jgi:hypothetical protein
VFPPELHAELIQTLDINTIQALAEHGLSTHHADIPYYQTSFCRAQPPARDVLQARDTCGSLASAVKPEAASPWYLALPSIQFAWAAGTYQEAVTRGLHHKWSLEDTYNFLLRTLRALRSLHNLGFIHGDLRPANILSVGALSNPLSFRVADYGSFNTVATIDAGQRPETGHTQIGPATANHRTSIFYSPERRAGNERETADIAVVLRNVGADAYPDEYLLCLGWRNTLLAEEPSKSTGSRLKAEARRELLAIWDHMKAGKPGDSGASRPEELAPGDRLRVRDLIVTIKGSYQASPVEPRQPGVGADLPATYLCFRCDNKHWRVLHEKISVCDLDDKTIDDETVISLASYTELPMWSAATDLYSVGVLALYSLFTRDTTLHPAQIEEQLAIMVETLENTSYFRVFWGYLENFRAALEAQRDLAALNDLANDAVRRLIGSVPYMRRIAAAFTNTADFLLFVHYVLACMHRQNTLSGHPGPIDPPCGPFCESRADSVTRGSAARAHDRLADLLRRLIRGGSTGFGEIVAVEEMDPTANQTIEIMTLRDELSRIKGRFAAQNTEVTALGRDVLSARDTIASLEARYSDAERTRQDLETRCAGTSMTNQQLLAEAKLRQNELARARQDLSDARTSAEQLQSRLTEEQRRAQQLAQVQQQLAHDRQQLLEARQQLTHDLQQLDHERNLLYQGRQQLAQESQRQSTEPLTLTLQASAEPEESAHRPTSALRRTRLPAAAIVATLALCLTFFVWPNPTSQPETTQPAPSAAPTVASPLEPAKTIEPPPPPPAEILDRSPPKPLERPAQPRDSETKRPTKKPRINQPDPPRDPRPSDPRPDPLPTVADSELTAPATSPPTPTKPGGACDTCTGMAYDDYVECCDQRRAEAKATPS